MEEGLAQFLAELKPFWSGRRTWPNGFDLDTSAYLHRELPPSEFVSSVRAVLVTSNGIAMLHNPDGSHILPGGRREDGESLVETLAREVYEETRCTIDEPKLLGFIHIRILSPKPENYPYPYPDLLQLVFVAKGVCLVKGGTDPDGWEERAEFVPLDELRSHALAEHETMYLNEGLRLLDAL